MKKPKLKWPLATKGLSPQDRAILLAYDILWRITNEGLQVESTDENMESDIEANMETCGYLIEHHLPKHRDEDGEWFEPSELDNGPLETHEFKKPV